MAGVEFNKTSPEWKMFTEYWKLCQKFWEPEDSDDYWKEVVDAARDFAYRNNTEFAKTLALTFLNELERKWREAK